MNDVDDIKYMKMAIEAARRCESEPGDPFVGAVAVRDNQVLGVAHRGELRAGDHAEFTLIGKKLRLADLVGATVYTTLEPCTVRGPEKHPCVEWLIDSKVRRVVIGMFDPNLLVSGYGCLKLRKANIVTDLFPPELMTELEALNLSFIRNIEKNPTH